MDCYLTEDAHESARVESLVPTAVYRFRERKLQKVTAPAMEKVTVLLVEDSPGDARLILEAFKESEIRTEVKVVQDGVEAIAFLRREGVYADETRPDLILLDLNLPRKDGREVLAEIKNDDEFKQIPVLVLTTSDQSKDILASYESHANSYITKPIDMDTFFKTMKSLEDFWFHVVKLPPHDDPQIPKDEQ